MLVEFKRIIANFDKKTFTFYFAFTIILLLTLIVLSTVKLTQARYETNATINVSPSLAFFIVDVASETGQIKLESMVPSDGNYDYIFQVSNFNSERRANVDLTYSIEIITTTNMPLQFKVFRRGNLQDDLVNTQTLTTDANGVFYRHLIINNASVMNYSSNHTDEYVLRVKFPLSNKDNPDGYAGVIDLVDIKINAEQVV